MFLFSPAVTEVYFLFGIKTTKSGMLKNITVKGLPLIITKLAWQTSVKVLYVIDQYSLSVWVEKSSDNAHHCG